MNAFNNPSNIRIGGSGIIASTLDIRPDLATHNGANETSVRVGEAEVVEDIGEIGEVDGGLAVEVDRGPGGCDNFIESLGKLPASYGRGVMQQTREIVGISTVHQPGGPDWALRSTR
jgi:hypothetical protein